MHTFTKVQLKLLDAIEGLGLQNHIDLAVKTNEKEVQILVYFFNEKDSKISVLHSLMYSFLCLLEERGEVDKWKINHVEKDGVPGYLIHLIVINPPETVPKLSQI